MRKIVIFVTFLCLVIFMFNCKTNNELGLIEQQLAEEAFGLTASTVTDLIASVYQTSISLNYKDGSILTSHTKGIELNTSYNNATGWWTISFNYNGYQASLEIQIQDGFGNFQKNVNSNASKIIVKGSGSGTELTFTLDWTISGIESQSSVYIINGSGTLEYEGESISFTLAGAEIKKQGTLPSAGTLRIEIGGISVVLTYDGNAIITLSYSYNGENYKISINIQTGAVTRL